MELCTAADASHCVRLQHVTAGQTSHVPPSMLGSSGFKGLTSEAAAEDRFLLEKGSPMVACLLLPLPAPGVDPADKLQCCHH